MAAERERFRFISDAVSEDTFHVVRFSGEEGLSRLYRFEITLASSRADLDGAALLRAGASLQLVRDGGDAVFRGILTEVVQTSHYNGFTFYTAVLQPRFQILTRVVRNAIFMEQTVREVAESAMAFSPSFSLNHEFRLLGGDYPRHEFTLQYNETVFDYICHKLENEGIYYFFEPAGSDEKVVFTDSPLAHTDLSTPKLIYSPPGGLEASHLDEVIAAFSLRSSPLPAKVVLRSYDWMKPNEPVAASSPVSSDGLGDVYYYGENFTTAAEGRRLAAIRAQKLRCRASVYSGLSSVPILRPGFRFALERHYRADFNRTYTLTEVRHHGSQEGYLAAALGIWIGDGADAEHSYYRNEFSCIASDEQFRPARVAPRNKIQGVLPAFIDAAGSGTRPELDEYGRYKVIFPFDLSGRDKGRASCWLRMTQAYAGKSFGTSFPLTAGTEVAVSFVDGDPDRPLITGALNNAETGAIVNSKNPVISGISTAGGNALAFSDEEYKQGITLSTTSGRSMLSMSAGSTDATATTSDILVSSASLFGSEMSALGKSMWSSFRSVDLTGLGWEYNLCTAMASAMNAADKMFASAAEQTGESGWNIGASLAKSAALTCQMALGTKAIATGKAPFGYMINAAEDGSTTLLQTPPKLSELLGPILTAAAGMAVTATADGVTATEKGDKEIAEKQAQEGTDNDIEKNVKAQTRKSIAASTLETLLPEIISMCLSIIPTYAMLKKHKAEGNMGGVLLKTDSNIALATDKEVHVTSAKDILICAAGDAPAALMGQAAAVRPDLKGYVSSFLKDAGRSDGVNQVVLSGHLFKTFASRKSSHYALSECDILAGDAISLICDGDELGKNEYDAKGVFGEAQTGGKAARGSGRLDLKNRNVPGAAGASAELKVTDEHGKLTLERSDSDAGGSKQTVYMNSQGISLNHTMSNGSGGAYISLLQGGGKGIIQLLTDEGIEIEVNDSEKAISLGLDKDTSVVLKPDGVTIKGKTVKIIAGNKTHTFDGGGLDVTGEVKSSTSAKLG